MPMVGVQVQAEVAEAFLVPLEKATQVEVRAVLAVPFLQLLELRTLGERGHGDSSGVHGLGRAWRRKRLFCVFYIFQLLPFSCIF